jgi:sugar phosphate isomerase/epimerase
MRNGEVSGLTMDARGAIHGGLVSVTFRQLKPREVLRLIGQAGLETVEWHGEAHVPHGDLKTAREVTRMTSDAGVRVAAYGSYYRVGQQHDAFTFEQVVETASVLGAPTIRVWAGNRGSAEADEAYRASVVFETRRIADLAGAAGMTVSYEWHGSTLTDTDASALQLLSEVANPAVRSYWQPREGGMPEHCLEGLHKVLPWLTNVHVFHWMSRNERRPLAEGKAAWEEYLRVLASDRRDHCAMIEFVVNDSPDQFLVDAATLKAWLSTI